jgi:hypothetical protein
MTEKKLFTPNAVKQSNGYYRVSIYIYPKGLDYKPQTNETYPIGKIVMCEILSETKAQLLFPGSLDNSWEKSNYKEGWYEKIESINAINFNPH